MTMQLDDDTRSRILSVELIALDVDGVMTDGRLVYLPDGAFMPSGFNVQDGLGVRVAIESGLKVIFVSGNGTQAVKSRAEHLKISAHYLGVGNKMEALASASEKFGIPLERFAFVGDDLNDLAALKSVGLGVAVAQAPQEVKDAARLITVREGGFGAVREIIELILREQGRWESAVARFMAEIAENGFVPVKG